jgi:hypothetical protein
LRLRGSWVDWQCPLLTTTVNRRLHDMIRSGNSIRFTRDEIADFRNLGLDFEGARTENDVASVIAHWAHTLADERPDLLETIASEMARAKGVTLPPKLSVVPSPRSPRQS